MTHNLCLQLSGSYHTIKLSPARTTPSNFGFYEQLADPTPQEYSAQDA